MTISFAAHYDPGSAMTIPSFVIQRPVIPGLTRDPCLERLPTARAGWIADQVRNDNPLADYPGCMDCGVGPAPDYDPGSAMTIPWPGGQISIQEDFSPERQAPNEIEL